MHNRRKFRLSIVLLIGLVGLGACSNEKGMLSFEVQHPGDKARNAALVVIPYRSIAEKAEGKPSAFYKVTINSELIPSQMDDLDGDGQWDELVFVQDFKASEKLTVELLPVATKPGADNPARAHVRHQRKTENNYFGPALASDTINGNQQPTDFSKQKLPPFLTEGPAWENDRVGFRIYFDSRNGKDIWGKLRPEMVLDKVGIDTASNYHALSDWGMDLLKVGASLGAGALALYIPDIDGKDTLVRVGGSNMGKISYERVADGPVRAIFRMHYNDWKIHPAYSPVSITEEVSIWAGQLFYESAVTVKQLPASASLVTGLVNLYEAPKMELNARNAVALYTHHRQSENKDVLGMAILLLKKDWQEFGTARNSDTDIRNTYLVKMRTENNQTSRFRFYAAWEKTDSSLATPSGFESYLQQQLTEFQQLLIIR
jgi:hypothetical protein